MSALLEAPLVEVTRVPYREDEFGEVGFTGEDRKTLTTLEANYQHIHDLLKDFKQTFEERMLRLERFGVMREEMARVEQDLRRELGEKANRTELQGSALTNLQERAADVDKKLTEIDKSIVWVYAFAAGAAAAGGGLAGLIIHFWK